MIACMRSLLLLILNSMKKIETFFIFLLLIVFWSLFFGACKLYFWSILSTGLSPSLELIAGFLSAGGVFAYIIGGALTDSFYKRSVLIICSVGALIFLVLGILFGTSSMIVFAPIVMGIGFFYSLWSVVRSILISIEIHKTGYPDAVVTGIANILFVVFVIFGVVLGPILAADMGLIGSVVLGGMLLVTVGLAGLLDYEPVWHWHEILAE